VRPLGVGLVYLTELDPLFREGNSDLSVLEVEPQMFWEKIRKIGGIGDATYMPNTQVMSRIAALPQHKLVHGVGFPIGGSVCCGGDYITPLADAITSLRAAWLSEHLSFNAIKVGGTIEQVGLLLPPRQTRGGIDAAVCNIRRLVSQLPGPFAFETGVNYLQPRADELPDGSFFASIADEADCGILLDLHNLWVNERNGRERVVDVIEALPLDRVWEVHLAGGMMLGDYYLDSHSDAIPMELLEIATQVIPRLPNLGALIFEILPGYVPQLGLDNVRKQLTLLNSLWRLRPSKCVSVPRRPARSLSGSNERGDAVEWEQILGKLAVEHGNMYDEGNMYELGCDEGVKVLQTLVGEFRDAQISRAMRFTLTLLLAHLGPVTVRELLHDYHKNSFPDFFASGEADQFAGYLRARLSILPPVPFLLEVLNFEHALIRAALYGAGSRIEWKIDPTQLFSALEQGRVPSTVNNIRLTMNIVPEG
jgi:uncharacterized protein (UPF0276 family)